MRLLPPRRTSFQDSSLDASTSYSYAVSAYDAAGNESSRSSADSATTLDAAVLSSLNLTPSAAQVEVGGSQQFTATGEDQYRQSDLGCTGLVGERGREHQPERPVQCY